ncbi:MAG TPA: pyruvoyl-dependent arginine decarboxylase [Candidatus Tectomicrobia bacterium]|jgi:arginine decarboxylase
MVPKQFCLTKGIGRHAEQLASFEVALRDAGIQYCNLVNVSSIVPPYCEQLPRDKGVEHLRPGQITYVVLARLATNYGSAVRLPCWHSSHS